MSKQEIRTLKETPKVITVVDSTSYFAELEKKRFEPLQVLESKEADRVRLLRQQRYYWHFVQD